MKECPSQTCLIGSMVKFGKNIWQKNHVYSDNTYRVFEIHMSGTAKNQDLSATYNAAYSDYDMEMTIGLELESCPKIHVPQFKAPDYPVLVEGKIVSESGEDTDKTYQIYTDENTSLEEYSVHIPLWDRKIKAPFIPGIFTGHFYFPAFKHARVLVALYLDRAEILQFLDWGEGSRLPMDAQGNHILFGKNASSQTSMRYLYTEGKPELTIKRTSQKDTEMIRMEEESIIIQTQDEEE